VVGSFIGGGNQGTGENHRPATTLNQKDKYRNLFKKIFYLRHKVHLEIILTNTTYYNVKM
jgi:hypothetical protein